MPNSSTFATGCMASGPFWAEDPSVVGLVAVESDGHNHKVFLSDELHYN